MNNRQITNLANLRSGDRCHFVDGSLGTIAGFSLLTKKSKSEEPSLFIYKGDPVIVMDDGDINIFSANLFTIIGLSNNEYQNRLDAFEHIENFTNRYEIDNIASALYEKEGKLYIEGFPDEPFAIFNISTKPIYAVTDKLFTSELITT